MTRTADRDFPSQRGFFGLSGGAEAAAVLLVPLVMTVVLAVSLPTSLSWGIFAVVASLVAPAAAAVWVLRRGADIITAADRVTGGRIILTGVLSGALVMVHTGDLSERTWLVAVLAAMALSLDAVDGWVARLTHSDSEAGARLDMEADAALLVVLCLLAAPVVGWWVLAIGAMRYVFVAASWFRPRLRSAPPPSLLRRPIAAAQGISLLTALVPWVAAELAVIVCACALILLTSSFLRDVVALEWSNR